MVLRCFYFLLMRLCCFDGQVVTLVFALMYKETCASTEPFLPSLSGFYLYVNSQTYKHDEIDRISEAGVGVAMRIWA